MLFRSETADTLAPLKYCKAQAQHILSVVNVPESAVARESDVVLQTLAGPEIGVASTKAFTSQLVALHLLALHLAQVRATMPTEDVGQHLADLLQIPQVLEQAIKASALSSARPRAPEMPPVLAREVKQVMPLTLGSSKASTMILWSGPDRKSTRLNSSH